MQKPWIIATVGKGSAAILSNTSLPRLTNAIASSALFNAVNSSMSAPAAKPLSFAERMARPLGGIDARWSAICPSSRSASLENVLVVVPARSKRSHPRWSASMSSFQCLSSIFSRYSSLRTLDQHRAALAPADAQRRDPAPPAGALQHLEHVQHDARPRGADRVPDGDRAAVDVELGAVELAEGALDAEVFAAIGFALERGNTAQHLRGKGFVDLHRVDVVPREAVAHHHRRDRMDWAQAHLGRVQRPPVNVDDSPERVEPVFVHDVLGGEHQHRGAVGDLRAVAGGG